MNSKRSTPGLGSWEQEASGLNTCCQCKNRSGWSKPVFVPGLDSLTIPVQVSMNSNSGDPLVDITYCIYDYVHPPLCDEFIIGVHSRFGLPTKKGPEIGEPSSEVSKGIWIGLGKLSIIFIVVHCGNLVGRCTSGQIGRDYC